MGHRRLDTRHRDREDGIEAPGRAVRASAAAHGEGVRDHLLSLQRDYGNTAVTTVIQRRERAASTDAPGYKKKKKAAPKKAAPVEDYSPKEANTRFHGMTSSDIQGHAREALDQNAKNSWSYASDLYEELWFRTKDRGVALNISRAYTKLKDEKRAAWWMAVHHGTIKPGQPKVEDQTDKYF